MGICPNYLIYRGQAGDTPAVLNSNSPIIRHDAHYWSTMVRRIHTTFWYNNNENNKGKYKILIVNDLKAIWKQIAITGKVSKKTGNGHFSNSAETSVVGAICTNNLIYFIILSRKTIFNYSIFQTKTDFFFLTIRI